MIRTSLRGEKALFFLRIGIIDLTPAGEERIVPAFRRRAAILEKVFAILITAVATSDGATSRPRWP